MRNLPSPDVLFRELAARLGTTLRDEPARKFGAGALKVEGRIYAALSRSRLLLKLPATRVDALVAAKLGERFSTGGRPKKEWITIGADGAADWLALAREARDFVAGRSG